MHACTIVARNYLAQAQVLVDSFRVHHPDGEFVVLLLDDPGTGRPDVAGAEVMLIDEIGIPAETRVQMTLTYSVIELATAVKPWLLRTLLDRFGDHATYFDPDILIERAIHELPQLAREHSIVLTPHVLEPMPRDGRKPTEQGILIAGVYNLGFVSVGDTEEARRMLDWWSERLETECIVDPEHGFFVDQRWMDFVPSLFDYHLVRDPSWNVAYWNLPSRELTRDAEGGVLVNGHPLTFIHFSGYSPRKPHLLSKHQADDPRVRLSERPILRELCDEYGRRLLAAGFDGANRTFKAPFSAWDGIDLDDRIRRLLRESRDAEEPQPSPDRPGAFIDWLVEPSATQSSTTRLGRYLLDIYLTRPDLQRAYPQVATGDVRGFLDWAAAFGVHECGIPTVVIERTRASAAPALFTRHTAAVPVSDVLKPGVEVAGYLSADLGIGEAARGIVAGLDQAGIPVSTRSYDRTMSRLDQQYQDRVAAAGSRHDVLITCVNADMLPAFLEDVGPGYAKGRYHIGCWYWELDDVPEQMIRAAELLDEVWVTTDFVADALRRRLDVPVTLVPLPVAAPPTFTDAEMLELVEPLGLADDVFTVLFVFDYLSVFERKNPLGLVEAFTRAFGDSGSKARLVIKTINGSRRAADDERLRYAINGRKDVMLIDRYLERDELAALMQRADVYASLHRSEGFGLTLAESMAQGVPVIATRYSGNLTFMNDANSWLVDSALVKVPAGCEPYPTSAEWAEPDLDQAAAILRRMASGDADVKERAERARADVAKRLSTEAFAEVATRRLDEIRAKQRVWPLLRPSLAVRRKLRRLISR